MQTAAPKNRSETVRKDPRIRADGKCAQCRGPRLIRLPQVITQRNKTELLKHLALDAFCSAVCARQWHRVDIADQPQKSHGPEDE